MSEIAESNTPNASKPSAAYHLLRYVPNVLRDEWVNIGVLVFHPQTGERRLRLIEDQDEYNRVRRLHPWADEALLRALRDELEDRLDFATPANGNSNSGFEIPWTKILSKWDETLSAALQITTQKGVLGEDLDAAMERLYADHVAVPRRTTRAGLPGSRANIRSWCNQVFRQAHIWDRLETRVRVAEFTFPGDPARIDYSYRRNGTRGFIHTLSVTRAPQDAKSLTYNVKHIADKASYHTEFAAVTDVRLTRENERHRFVLDTLGEAGIEPVPTEGLAVWVAKLRPSLLQ
jgi:hypothetical protein